VSARLTLPVSRRAEPFRAGAAGNELFDGTAFVTVKTAALTPMPIASVMTATMVKAGERRMPRSA